MSVRELVLIPKQKLETLSKNSLSEKMETLNVGTQTESAVVESKGDIKEEQISFPAPTSQNEDADEDKFVFQRLEDGIPGRLNRKKRRKTLKWKPY